jgi:hypothetical protein
VWISADLRTLLFAKLASLAMSLSTFPSARRASGSAYDERHRDDQTLSPRLPGSTFFDSRNFV